MRKGLQMCSGMPFMETDLRVLQELLQNVTGDLKYDNRIYIHKAAFCLSVCVGQKICEPRAVVGPQLEGRNYQ